MKLTERSFPQRQLRRAVKATFPFFALMGGGAVASTRTHNLSMSRNGGRQVAAIYVAETRKAIEYYPDKNDVNPSLLIPEYGNLTNSNTQEDFNSNRTPVRKANVFGAFSRKAVSPKETIKSQVNQDVLKFLTKNGFLTSGQIQSAKLSGNLNSRKMFMHGIVSFTKAVGNGTFCANPAYSAFTYSNGAAGNTVNTNCTIFDTGGNPVAGKTGITGEANCIALHSLCDGDTPPTATSVSFTGSLQEGQTLNGSYTYNDADSDPESGTTFKWYRSNDAGGTGKTAIGGATSQNYTLVAADVGKYISFEVTPINANATGSAVESSINANAVTAANSAPEFDDADDIISLTLNEDASATTIAGIGVTDTDVGDILTWTEGSTAPTKGTTNFVGTATATGAAGDLPTTHTYTPTSNLNGADTFTINVSDTTDTDTLTVNVTINAVNDEPSLSIGANQSNSGADGGVLQTVNAFASMSSPGGGTDENTQTISDFIVSEASDTNNVVSGVDISNAGVLTYTPANNVDGVATINVQVQDDGGTANSGDDTSTVSQFTITVDTLGPTISAVSIPNSAMKVGDTVPVTITVADDGGEVYTNLSGTIGGFTLGSLSRTNNTTYAAQFTVGNGGTDVAAGSSIPVSLTLDDTSSNTSSTFNTPISQNADSIDANNPTVTNVSIPNTAMKIGDAVTVSITAGEAGLSLNTGTLNGVAVTGFTDNTGGSYSATYTVASGHTDRAVGDSIPVNFILQDAAGNTNTAFTTAISQNADSIDANQPVISNVSIPNSTMKVGDSVTATITVTDDGGDTYTGLSGTIGGFTLGSLSRTDNTTYTAQFTVGEGGTDVAAGSDIPVSLTLDDSAGNTSSTFNTAISQNADSIDANSPTVTNVSIPNTAMKIGDAVTVSITAGEAGLSLNTGTINGVAVTGFSDGGGGSYSATYTVANGHTDRAAGDSIPVNFVLQDSSGNTNTAFTTAITQNADSIDASQPTVTSVTVPSNATYAQGQNLDFTVNTNEAVTVNTGGGTPSLSLTIGATGKSATYESGSGSTALLFRYTVEASLEDLDGIALGGSISLNSGTIQDSVGNGIDLTLNSVGVLTAVLVDSTPPAAPSTPDLDNASDTGSSNSDDITGNNTPTFTGTAEANSTVELFYGGTNSLGTTTATGIGTWSITATSIPSGPQNITAKATDAGGNTGAASSALSIEVDTTAPSVNNVSSGAADTTYPLAATIPITVEFNDNVDVTGTPQLSLETGDSDAIVDYSSGTGTTTLTFNYDVVSGHKNSDLSYLSTSALALNGGNIADLAGNVATLTLPTPGAAGSLSANKNIDVDASLVINEVDYDQGTTDTIEFIELKNLTGSSVNLAAYNLTLVDSGGGSTYRVITPTGTIAAGDYYVICSDNTKVLHCDHDITPDTNFINDGAPHAISLNKGAVVLDALSYEGDTPGFTETTGAVADDGATDFVGLSRFADGTDTNDNSTDFSLKCVTPGGANNINANSSCFNVTIDDPTAVSEGDSGTTAVSFTVSLSNAATSDVVVNYSTADNTATSAGSDYASATSSATISAGSTSQNINVNVNGDKYDESNETFFVNLTGITANAVITDNQGTGSITDDDTAGISVSPTSGLSVNENGSTDTFTVVLDSRPTNNVTIPISSSDTSEGTVSPSSLTFTDANWNSAQTVTVTGADDFLIDGNQGFSIITGAATSSDGNYSGSNASDVTATNVDTDVPGFTVTPSTGLVTTEEGFTAATFTVKLNTQPTADVSIALSSSDTTEGTISPSSLTFTNANWNTEQTVTITNVNDFVVDGPITYSIVTAAAVSSDGDYSGKNPTDVSITNRDNDTLGLTLDPSKIVLKEPSDSQTFTVALKTIPTASVTVPFSVVDATECSITASSLTFTTGNWNVGQPITVSVIDDAAQDGNTNCNVVTGNMTGGDYAGLNYADLSVTIIDDDIPQDAYLTINDASIIEADAGSNSNGTFMVSLNPPLTTAVSVDYLTEDITATAGTDYSSASGTLTFNPGDMEKTVIVSVTGDNTASEGKERFKLKLNNAVGAVIDDPVGIGTILDNDGTPGFSVDDIKVDEGDTGIQEIQFTVNLLPASGVQTTVSYATSDDNATDGADYTAVTPATLTFAPGQTSEKVTVVISADTLAEEDEVFFLDLSGATGGAIIVDAQGTATIIDDDLNDGVPTDVENEAPNSGDGNNDGTPDGKQPDIASRPAANNPEQYITAKVSDGSVGTCNAILEVDAIDESSLSVPDNTTTDFPSGLLGFVLNCQTAAVKLYYHGVTSTSNLVVRKFINNNWITLSDAVLATENIGGNTVVTASFSLQDNDPGDACPEVGKICDPVGVATRVLSSSGGTSTTAPEIEIRGNGLEIVDGDNLARVADHTQFNDTLIGESSLRTFSIFNQGNEDLNISDITITGAHSSRFSLSGVPTSAIGFSSGANVATFQVSFNPIATGTYIADINIDNNDADESPYTFQIKGTAIEDSSTSEPVGPDTDTDNDGIPDIVEELIGHNPLVKDNDVLGNSRLFVMQLYRNFLFREGEDEGVTHWQSVLEQPNIERRDIVNRFRESEEMEVKVIPIIRLYFAYFNRLPDLDGLKYWINLMFFGSDLNTISEQFATSSEFQNQYGQLDDEGFIQLVYQNIFGRAADSEGLNFWLSQLADGVVTRGQMMADFSESTEYKKMTENAGDIIVLYLGLLNRMPDQNGVNYWIIQLDDDASLLDIIEFFLATSEYYERFYE